MRRKGSHMLQLNHIKKEYKTGDLVQKALDDVSLNLRDNEFVAILGPSGSGKTTLLNVIGGLDRYDSGDLIINGISTKKYTDRDWDSYRNHTIGFVFQSYNLIPHQTVLSNVELALTISGISGAERRNRATKALEQVGLGDQLHKHPSEMSGGQMQRVAIARALVNNPDILLADEPTGALDSETSIQVMELLKEVAKDRLVVMVTHNPELAQQYATRIVNLKDGVIRSDTAPYKPDTTQLAPAVHKNMGHSSMSWWTSLTLSFNNLWTKKTRTLLTAFAGSIGIIGIALIISLSTGVNQYIADMERDTLSEYPVQILRSGMDLTSLLSADLPGQTAAPDLGEGMVPVRQLVTQMVSGITSNDLKSLKAYLESDACSIGESVSSVELRRDCRSSRSPTSASRVCVSAAIDCERSSASALIRASSASSSARACSVCAAVAVMPSRRDCTSPSSSLCRCDASSAAAAAEAAAAGSTANRNSVNDDSCRSRCVEWSRHSMT